MATLQPADRVSEPIPVEDRPGPPARLARLFPCGVEPVEGLRDAREWHFAMPRFPFRLHGGGQLPVLPNGLAHPVRSPPEPGRLQPKRRAPPPPALPRWIHPLRRGGPDARDPPPTPPPPTPLR